MLPTSFVLLHVGVQYGSRVAMALAGVHMPDKKPRSWWPLVPFIVVILIAATNTPEVLDAALLRAGRFDRQVLVDRPDVDGREAILKVHAAKVRLSPIVDLRIIAVRTPGMVARIWQT